MRKCLSGRTPSQNKKWVNALEDITDYALDTQRAPSERKYINSFGNYLTEQLRNFSFDDFSCDVQKN